MNQNIDHRIVSLVPSITELLYHLGLGEQIVGITRFCILPLEKNGKATIVGGTKDFKVELIEDLNPTIIFANKEENDKEGIEKLNEKFQVIVTDIKTMSDALEMILHIGQLLNVELQSRQTVEIIRDSLVPPNELKPAIYLIWNNPLMTIGGDTFISHMMPYAGLENVFSSQERYPIITEEDIASIQPKYLLLSSEPYAYRRHHVDYYQQRFPKIKPMLVDGQMFSWYGSRLIYAADYFKKLSLS